MQSVIWKRGVNNRTSNNLLSGQQSQNSSGYHNNMFIEPLRTDYAETPSREALDAETEGIIFFEDARQKGGAGAKGGHHRVFSQ